MAETRHGHHHGPAGGASPWNQGQAPVNWWQEVKRSHGHVGPWNVLGYRMGQAALREFGSQWGYHDLDIVCYIPMRTPFSCLADGVVIGTGNSIGRLDIRLAEAASLELIEVIAWRKDGEGGILRMKPDAEYLASIRSRPVEQLESLSVKTRDMAEGELFELTMV